MAAAIVLDANVAVRAVLDRQERALNAFDEWNEQGFELIAPDLWLPEVVSAIRRAMASGKRPAGFAEASVDGLLALGVTLIRTDRDLSIAALRWADRIGQAKAYDGLYLAVAERQNARFVTVDQRLLARCSQLGIDFVESLPEAAA